jgi:hypothetical protein
MSGCCSQYSFAFGIHDMRKIWLAEQPLASSDVMFLLGLGESGNQ